MAVCVERERGYLFFAAQFVLGCLEHKGILRYVSNNDMRITHTQAGQTSYAVHLRVCDM